LARISVEQKALSDPRFTALAAAESLTDRDHALGRMVRVWNECIERGAYALPPWIVCSIFGSQSSPASLVACDLAEWDGDNLRIKGTKDRTEYLEKLRAANRQRQRAKRERDSTVSHALVTRDNGGALALALAPAPDSESLSVARAPSERNGEMTHDRVRTAWAKLFDQFYDSYPRKGHRPAAMKKWIARCPEWTVATKSDPKLAVQTRYGEIIDRVNEVSEEQGDNLGAGVTKFTPYADAFLNREF
jgi:hypothetical protein